MENKIEYNLCAPPRCSCPKMILDFEACEVTITDDYDGTVRLTFEDLTVLSRSFLTHV